MGLIISSRYNNKSTNTFIVDGTYVVPPGQVIDLIKLVPSANMAAVSIGITPAGGEILPGDPLTGGETSLLGVLLDAGTTIYFEGITAPMQVTFYRK